AARRARSAERLLLFLDPCFRQLVHRLRIAAGRVDARSDAHRDGPGTLEEGVARPEKAGVVRYRHHRRTRCRGEPRAAKLISAPFTAPHARSLWEDHHPEALREPLAAAPG